MCRHSELAEMQAGSGLKKIWDRCAFVNFLSYFCCRFGKLSTLRPNCFYEHFTNPCEEKNTDRAFFLFSDEFGDRANWPAAISK